MPQPYLGEIKMFAGNFAPQGWMFCSGQVLPISQFTAFFSLIGTTYGGDGQDTFQLPDLRGRLPLHFGNGFNQSQTGGTESVLLTVQQMPNHNHSLQASRNSAAGSTPEGNVVGEVGATQVYREIAPSSALSGQAIQSTGGNQPHDNFQPYLCVNFIVAVEGIFP